MPNRIIREAINESEGLAVASPFAQDLFKRLITYADDFGRFNANVGIMRARLYPLELDAVIAEDVDAALVELCGVDKITFYRSGVTRHVYGYFPKWSEHQRLRHTRGKHPDPASGEVFNDWALQRFIPITRKREIFERDGFTCQLCKRSFELPGVPTAEAVRVLSSVLHVDHVVPILEGGRATPENLRLTCRSCNLSRKRRPFAANGGELPQDAADGGLSRSRSLSRSLSDAEAKAPAGYGPDAQVRVPGTTQGSAASPLPPSKRISFDKATGTITGILQSDLDLWVKAYPQVKLAAEIVKAGDYLRDNRRTNISRFLRNWLTRAQAWADEKQAAPNDSGAGRPAVVRPLRSRERWDKFQQGQL